MRGRKTRTLIVRWLVAAFLLTGTALIDAADQVSRTPAPAAAAVQHLPTTADIPVPRLGAAQRRMRERFETLKRLGPHGVPPMARLRAIETMQAMPSMPVLSNLAGTWSFIGPDAITNGQGNNTSVLCGLAPPRIKVSGRVTAIAFGGEGTYLGSANGGLWKSTDQGSSWTPLTDQQPSLAVGGLAVVAGRTHDTIYIGTGEGNNSCDSEFGQGVLKSTDGGATWSAPLGAALFDRLTFAKLTVDPQNSDVLYAGTTFGYSGATTCVSVSTGTSGVYKSTDAGNTWFALAGGLPAGSVGNNFAGSAYDVAVDVVGSYSGPLSGIVKDTSASPPCNPGAAPGQATLTAVDPANPGNPNPFTINVTPHIGGGFDLTGTLALTQNPAPLAVPPGVCTDFRGVYDCMDREPDLRKTTGIIIQCFQRSAPFIEVDLVGNANPDGTLTGEWSSVAGVFLQDVVSNTPFTLKGGSNVYAGIGGLPAGPGACSDPPTAARPGRKTPRFRLDGGWR